MSGRVEFTVDAGRGEVKVIAVHCMGSVHCNALTVHWRRDENKAKVMAGARRGGVLAEKTGRVTTGMG